MIVHTPYKLTRISPNMSHKADTLDIAISNEWHQRPPRTHLRPLTHSDLHGIRPSLARRAREEDDGFRDPEGAGPPPLELPMWEDIPGKDN